MATNNSEQLDGGPEEDSPTAREARARGRSNWPTRLIPLSEEGNDEDVLAMTPGERIGMMWQLAVDAWAMRGVDVSNARVDRSIVRVIRRGKRSARDVDQQD